MAEYVEQPEHGVGVKEREKLERPRRYKVLLHNDNYTTMDFVIEVLEDIFRKTRQQAIRVMLDVHENGIGVAGVYVKQIAETKVSKTHTLAREHGYPLRCSIERE